MVPGSEADIKGSGDFPPYLFTGRIWAGQHTDCKEAHWGTDPYGAPDAMYSRIEEEHQRPKQDMKQIIHLARMEELIQEAVDAFIKKVTVYQNKRVEIEGNYSYGEE